MVTIDGGGTNNQWIFAAATKPISWITIDGNVNGASHLKVSNFNGFCDMDNGATGIVFRYIISNGSGLDSSGVGHGNCQFRGYNTTGIELDHCIIGPCVNVNRNVLGIGANANVTYTTNLIHDCTVQAYYIHGNNSVGGNGDDFMGDLAGCHIYHCNLIGIWLGNPALFSSDQSSQFTINQHQDGIQTGYDYNFVDSNYFEDCANYCVFIDYESGGGGNWMVINNVFNYADNVLNGQPSCGIAFGSHTSGATLSNLLIANNTVIGGGEGIADNLTTNVYSNVTIANNLCYGQGGMSINVGGPTAGLSILCNKASSGINPGNTQPPANTNNPTWINPSGSYPTVCYGSTNFQPASNDTGAVANGTNAFASTFNYDALGYQRPSGNWALGAFEMDSGVDYTTWENNLYAYMQSLNVLPARISKVKTWVSNNPPTLPYNTWESSLFSYMSSIGISPNGLAKIEAWVAVNPL